MKRNILALITLFISINLYAQKFETIKEYKFDDTITFFEKGIDDDGYNTHSGLIKLTATGKQLYFYTLAIESKNSKWIDVKQDNNVDCFDNDGGLYKLKKGLYFLINGSIKIYVSDFKYSNPDYILSVEKDFDLKNHNSIYLTENIVFAQTNDDKLVSWTLLEDGKSEYHGKEETQKMLDEGLAEKLGYHTNSRGSTKWFGEFNMTTGTGPNYSKILNDTVFKTEGYENEGPIQYWGYYIGTDKRGLSYFYQSSNIRTDFDYKKPMELKIAVLDPWTREVNVIELPAGDWNPARNENGLIASCSQCIDEDGNLYFTDCNKEKGCYEIKKLSNDWIKQYDFYNREIGRMNTNHIPLQKEAKTSAENNGFNFEHEYLWILEHGNEWCKIRKVDGREGWVETRYIEQKQETAKIQ